MKFTNLLLPGGAFIATGAASCAAIYQYDGSELFGVLTIASLLGFLTSGAYMWRLNTQRSHGAEWASLIKLLDGQYTFWSTGVRGSFEGIPVYARLQSQSNNLEYLDPGCALYSSARYFFALTLTLPCRERASWRILYKTTTPIGGTGDWRVACEGSHGLADALEIAGLTELLSGWDKSTVIKCEAEAGELTLRYPAWHRFFCPDPEQAESQINLLRRAGDIWQQVLHPRLAA